MFQGAVRSVPKVWSRFAATRNDGKTMKFKIEQLPKHRFEEFMDFNMNYFVRHEITHTVSGIPKSVDAMIEYKEILSNKLKKPSNHIFICTEDDDENVNDKILGFTVTRTMVKDDLQSPTVQAHTKEVKRFFKILTEWDNLYPVSGIFEKYGIDRYSDDGGAAVHPDYRGFGIVKKVSTLRRLVCQAHGIPMTGAWLTSRGSQIACENDGWETVYEISYAELGRILGVTFKNVPPICKYMIGKV